MNFNTTTIVIIAVAVIAVIYLITVLRKAAAKKASAVIPEPAVKKTEAETLKERMAPIVQEIETKQMANFIKHWSDKFANNTLTVQDVELLNATIEAGSVDQVNGILALHPNGRVLFNQINTELQQKAAALA